MLATELAVEQDHMDRAYARLEELQEQALGLATSDLQERASTPASAPERDARERHGLQRRAMLRVPGGLIFGRIDRTDGETYRIGRVGVSDVDQTPMVVDWRAPVAEAFYRATPGDAHGLVRRRHLFTRGRKVVGIEDEALDLDGDHHDLVLVGEAALLDAVRQRRTGHMRDIVSTIQSEQDRIIRAPLSGVVIVQGGPGTGKTAVALHRAAFLLYKYRFPLEQQGVLIVGPSPLFLGYIERVLPSLGESRARLTTVASLYDGAARPAAAERPEVARVKGDLRMRQVIAAAVVGRERPLGRKQVVGFGAYRLAIGPGSTGRILDAVKARTGTHNSKRPLVEQLVMRHLLRQYDRAVERAIAAGLPASRRPKRQVREVLERAPEVRAVLERIWPVLSPERLLCDLFAHRPLLEDACAAHLHPDEIALLERDAGAPWTGPDMALLDEARELLGPAPAKAVAVPGQSEHAAAMAERLMEEHVPRCRQCDTSLTYVPPGRREVDDVEDPDRVEAGFGMGTDGPPDWRCDGPGCGATYYSDEVMSPEAAFYVHSLWQAVSANVAGPELPEPPPFFATYGHVVVDEAQELSGMEWRMLARRCPSRSMTVVGDLDQGSGPSAAESWDDVLDVLQVADDDRSVVARLTVNYRTPREVIDLAERLMHSRDGHHHERARCVRDAGVEPRVLVVDGETALLDLVRDVVDEEREAVAGGKVAVLATSSHLDSLRSTLDATASLDAEIAVLDPDAAKGLEFDAVVIVEPALFEERALYVAMTRTTTRLAMVHHKPLPSALVDVS
ncbi:MAG TPA: ATP-binding domain-containing protein [Acidimicrobiales bacterium]|nr:ATP-binding domain-containing protein [Acidimicrobiales bacterium]